ncbi:MAG: hypothetical protein ACKPBB_00830 [Sphaerospermopsis kisseleviana]
MLYRIVYVDSNEKRIVTPEPVKFLFALRTVNGLNRYKVNPYGDYLIEPVEGTSGK